LGAGAHSSRARSLNDRFSSHNDAAGTTHCGIVIFALYPRQVVFRIRRYENGNRRFPSCLASLREGDDGGTAVQYSRLLIGRLLREEDGAEVLEYALVLGLISIVAISLIAQVGTKVAARWTSINSNM
jgi:Flp pilus assembly pilin Flp